MRKRSRKPLYVSARRAFCFLCRKFTQKSLKQIGKVIQRDHVLVLYQVRTTQDFLDIKDPQTVKEVKALTDLYYQAVLIKNKKRDQREELEKSQLKEIISDKVEP
jgi:histidinol phosphatase-like enzyme